jgi:hypothetical protein
VREARRVFSVVEPEVFISDLASHTVPDPGSDPWSIRILNEISLLSAVHDGISDRYPCWP